MNFVFLDHSFQQTQTESTIEDGNLGSMGKMDNMDNMDNIENMDSIHTIENIEKMEIKKNIELNENLFIRNLKPQEKNREDPEILETSVSLENHEKVNVEENDDIKMDMDEFIDPRSILALGIKEETERKNRISGNYLIPFQVWTQILSNKIQIGLTNLAQHFRGHL